MAPGLHNSEQLARINDGHGKTAWSPKAEAPPPYSFGIQWDRPQAVDRLEVSYADLDSAVVGGYELQVLEGTDWRTVTDDLFGHGKHVTHRFDAVTATALRLKTDRPSRGGKIPVVHAFGVYFDDGCGPRRRKKRSNRQIDINQNPAM